MSELFNNSSNDSNNNSCNSSSSNDVYFARGAGVQYTEGNKKYRQLVKEYAKSYKQTRKTKMKQFIAKELVDKVHDRGGKFFKQCHPCCSTVKTPEWVLLEPTCKDLMVKVQQALRDCSSNTNIEYSTTYASPTTAEEVDVVVVEEEDQHLAASHSPVRRTGKNPLLVSKEDAEEEELEVEDILTSMQETRSDADEASLLHLVSFSNDEEIDDNHSLSSHQFPQPRSHSYHSVAETSPKAEAVVVLPPTDEVITRPRDNYGCFYAIGRGGAGDHQEQEQQVVADLLEVSMKSLDHEEVFDLARNRTMHSSSDFHLMERSSANFLCFSPSNDVVVTKEEEEDKKVEQGGHCCPHNYVSPHCPSGLGTTTYQMNSSTDTVSYLFKEELIQSMGDMSLDSTMIVNNKKKSYVEEEEEDHNQSLDKKEIIPYHHSSHYSDQDRYRRAALTPTQEKNKNNSSWERISYGSNTGRSSSW